MASRSDRFLCLFLTSLLSPLLALLPLSPGQAIVTVPVAEVVPDLAQAGVPVLLPDELPFSPEETVYINSTVNPNGYSVEFEFLPDCGGTYCWIGSISAERGGRIEPPKPGETSRTIRLADGTEASFTSFRGAYITANLAWQSQGVLYRVTVKNGDLETLLQIANSAIAAGVRTAARSAMILQTSGMLGPGAPVLPSDGSYYQEHEFRGQGGQSVSIVMESDELDPYLILLSPDGRVLAQADDINSQNLNARIDIRLPDSGVYRIIANTYDSAGQGRYRLTVR